MTETGSCPKHGAVTDLSTSLAGGATRPARGMNNTWACSQANQSAAACPHGYQDDLFFARVEEVIHNASATPDVPLFLFWAPHAPHDPYEVPDSFLDKFAAIDVEVRQYYSAMVSYLDTNFGRLEVALRANGLWDNTLVVVSSDNGGPSYPRGGNNFPLRGAKSTNWEGGIRVNAFAFGGALDPALAGTATHELTAIEDWYSTFALLGGADTTDARAAAAGLPGVDGLDLRGLFVRGGNRTSPRTHVVIGDTKGDQATGNTTVGGILRNDGFKLLLGHVGDPVWQGPICAYRGRGGHARRRSRRARPGLPQDCPLHPLTRPSPSRRPQQDRAAARREPRLHQGVPLQRL
jgi:arylsulfatase I/J